MHRKTPPYPGYLKKLLAMPQLYRPGEVTIVDVYHDAACPKLSGGACTCDADVTVSRWSTPATTEWPTMADFGRLIPAKGWLRFANVSGPRTGRSKQSFAEGFAGSRWRSRRSDTVSRGLGALQRAILDTLDAAKAQDAAQPASARVDCHDATPRRVLGATGMTCARAARISLRVGRR